MHAHVESSRVGASAVAKGSSANPRELLLRLIEQHSNVKKEELFEIFRVEITDEPSYQRAVEWYFFINMYEYAVTSRSRTRDPVERAEAAARVRDRVEEIKAQIVLLDLTMPNGKAMKDCTGAEMARFGNRYQRIAEKVGKAKLVGAVLNEDQVKAIMK